MGVVVSIDQKGVWVMDGLWVVILFIAFLVFIMWVENRMDR